MLFLENDWYLGDETFEEVLTTLCYYGITIINPCSVYIKKIPKSVCDTLINIQHPQTQKDYIYCSESGTIVILIFYPLTNQWWIINHNNKKAFPFSTQSYMTHSFLIENMNQLKL